MRYLLDTNTVIALMKENPSVLMHVRRVGYANLCICSTVEAELWYGVAKSAHIEKNQAALANLLKWLPSLPFASEATRQFGNLRATLTNHGTPIGPFDLQIAAVTLQHGLTLVTHNTREFTRVPGLVLEDWLDFQRL